MNPLQQLANTRDERGKGRPDRLSTRVFHVSSVAVRSPKPAYAIAVDDGGHAYVTGLTDASDFPTVNGCRSPGTAAAPCDAFVVKLDPAGSALLYSTYAGGTQRGPRPGRRRRRRRQRSPDRRNVVERLQPLNPLQPVKSGPACAARRVPGQAGRQPARPSSTRRTCGGSHYRRTETASASTAPGMPT